MFLRRFNSVSFSSSNVSNASTALIVLIPVRIVPSVLQDFDDFELQTEPEILRCEADFPDFNDSLHPLRTDTESSGVAFDDIVDLDDILW